MHACRPRWIPHSSSCFKPAALTCLAALSGESASKQELVTPTICRQVCFIARAGVWSPGMLAGYPGQPCNRHLENMI